MTTVGLVNTGRTGALTIDSVDLSCPAWDIPDLSPLWISGSIRGQDRLIPGVAGVLAFRRRRTVTEVDLDMLISGDVDQTGSPYPDAMVGLETNLEVLRAGVVEPTNTGNGTRSATLTLPSGGTRTGYVHVLGLDTGKVEAVRQGAWVTHALVRGVLSLSIPAGRLT